MRARAVVLALLCGCTREPALEPRGDMAPPPALVDGCSVQAIALVHHDVAIALSLDPPSLEGQAAVTVTGLSATRRVALDVRGLRVEQVTVGGKAQRHGVSASRLCVELDEPLQAGQRMVIDVRYVASTSAKTPTFAKGAAWAGYDTASWMPTLHDASQRATLSLSVSVAPGVTVVASGRRVADPNGSGAAQRFALDTPSPPFLYAFAAGHFAQATRELPRGGRLSAYGAPGLDLERALAVTAPMVSFFEERIGVKMPGGEYAQVFVPGEAAQEAAQMALLSASSLDAVARDPTDDWLFAHELSHQWFGYLVPCADLADFWLNEGFATFFVAVYKEHRHGRASHDREVSLWRQRSARVHAEGRDAPLSLSGPSSPPRRPPTEAELPPRGVTYARGALVLDLLRRELGDEGFFAGVRRHVEGRPARGVRADDLRRALEASSGKPLTAFFEEKVYRPAPDL